jgi:hypothetical protein
MKTLHAGHLLMRTHHMLEVAQALTDSNIQAAVVKP